MDQRPNMEKEITTRAIKFIQEERERWNPFFAYVSFSLLH